MKESILRDYLDGYSCGELAPKYGVARHVIVGYVRRAGIARSQSDAKRLRDKKRIDAMKDLGEKRCSKCAVIKPLSDFRVRKSRNSYTSHCNSCTSAYDLSREKREYNAQKSRQHTLAQYGLTEDEFERMLIEQNFLCAICFTAPPAGKNLCVDHDHDTGEVRQLLCRRCNATLGLVYEDTDLLQAMAKYLDKHSKAGAQIFQAESNTLIPVVKK